MTKAIKGQRVATANIKADPTALVVPSGDGDELQLIQAGVMALVESSTDLVALSGLDQRMSFVNSAGRALVGLPDLEAVRQTTIADYFDQDTVARLHQEVLPAVLDQGHWQGVLDIRHFQSGDRIPLFFNSTLVRHSQTGEPIGIGTVGREMGLLQRMNQERQAAIEALAQLNQELEDRIRQRTAELQASEQKFRAIFNNTFQFTGLMTPDGILLEANQTALDFAGLQPQDVLHKPLWQSHWWSLSVAEQQRLQAAVAQAAQGKFMRYELDFRGRQDSVVTVDFSIRPLQDLTGRVVLLIPEARDISDRKQMEAQLRASNDRLAEANRELSRATRLKDEFMATMSHELRTPLSSILGMAQALRHEIYGSLSERQHHAIGIIERSGRHLLALINDVLDLAKIESGKMDLRLAPLTLRDLCDSSLSFVQPQAREKHIQMSVHLDQAPVHIEADELRLKQALINLMDNAVKFTPAGGRVSLTVEADADAGPTALLRFIVADTGPGIAPADYSRLFESFVQLDSSLTREHGGTGLGLALVKRITEMHGGQVTVESQLGRGSRFILHLPCPTVALAPSRGVIDISPQVAPAPPPPKGRILVAEDNPANRDLLVEVLQSMGYQVIAAHDGYDAIQKALAHPPDLVLMDIQMPSMDGLEAIRRMRAHPALEQRPIVALTALAMPGDRERCMKAGATAYLAKPLPLDGLDTLLQRILAPESALLE
ncbi:sensory box protein [Leptolyngbya sp. BL0902]|uniref:hybrid sensor histidine kinase/response regulator n=1 Tax=Leptolyngbya sp. BL0902 TaxID=1115757 RepID=UPI0018E8CDF3|nr:ATP-binding protein [Leptolyngbya sp. BL0902]QQE63386.1 sensory box protein [Leptolyngbya sp. BL0902]